MKPTLSVANPELAREWDYEKNAPLTPDDITAGSNKKVWWICSACNNVWQSSVYNRSNNRGCPKCARKKNAEKISKPKIGINDLGSQRPDLTKEWNYDKNGNLLPTDVAVSSKQSVWWKCSVCDCEWQSAVYCRSNYSGLAGCPVCRRKKLSNKRLTPIIGKNDLASQRPDIAAEWDYSANGDLKPTDVRFGSDRRVGWICSKGHKWDAKINNRTINDNGCPYCSNRKVLIGFNDLLTTNQELANEWDYEKNGELKPTDVTSGTHKKVWWRCQVCGNSWEASIVNRVRGTGCSKCQSHGTSKPEQGIAYYLSQITEVQQRIKIQKEEIDIYLPKYRIGIEYDGAYFHETEYKKQRDLEKTITLNNNEITLLRVQESDGNQVAGHVIRFDNDKLGPNYEWALHQLCGLLSDITNNREFSQVDIDIKRDYISIREKINLFHKERSLAIVNPELAKEWNFERNGLLKPEQVYAGSMDLVWWKCEKGHEWQDLISNRTGINKNGCPFCSNHRIIEGQNDLATLRPDLAKEWNYERNKGLTNKQNRDISTPDKVAVNSNQKVWWKCSICNYEWLASITNRSSKGRGCPVCSRKRVTESLSCPKIGINDLASRNPELAKEWNYEKNNPLTPEQVTYSANKKVWWKCPVCKNEWEATINNRSRGKGCPVCGKEKSRTAKYKSVVCIETGSVYSSIVEAEQKTGIKRSSIGPCCKGKQATAGGYHWKYTDECNNS